MERGQERKGEGKGLRVLTNQYFMCEVEKVSTRPYHSQTK